MFAATYAPSSSRSSLADAYRQVGTQTSITEATPHKLIQLLFDGFQESISLAKGAMRERRIEAKGRAISRALGIIEEGLHGSLNMEAGGRIAADLAALYLYVSKQLTHANIRNDEAVLDECARLIEPIRSAWAEIGPQVNAPRN
jgi:flagellar protein FliS